MTVEIMSQRSKASLLTVSAQACSQEPLYSMNIHRSSQYITNRTSRPLADPICSVYLDQRVHSLRLRPKMSTDAWQAEPFRIQETPLEGLIDRSYLQSVGYLMTATAIVIVVDPILQERATAYLWTIGAAPIWHNILTKSGYLEEVRDL
jgi:hypothetical protein